MTTLPSDAYATGQALVALNEAGMRKRAHAAQIYFDSGFLHGEHQYISSAATNWATQALILAQ